MEKLEYYYPKNTSIASILAAAGMTAVSGLLIYFSSRPWWRIPWLGRLAPGFSFWAGVIGVIFFGFCLIYLLYRMFTQQLLLEIKEEGVIEHRSQKLIPYEAIRKVSIKSHLGNRYILIDVHDEEELLRDVSFAKRTTMKLFKSQFGLSLVAIELPGKSRAEYEEIVKFINQKRRETKK